MKEGTQRFYSTVDKFHFFDAWYTGDGLQVEHGSEEGRELRRYEHGSAVRVIDVGISVQVLVSSKIQVDHLQSDNEQTAQNTFEFSSS